MKLKNLIDEDFVNYKKPSMVLGFPVCRDFKCDKECGQQVCQNSALATAPTVRIDDDVIIHRYLANPITQAVCLQGLEPLDSPIDMMNFIIKFREVSNDDIVIYTGYKKEEINPRIFESLSEYPNIIIKYGRYIPDQKPHYDEVLGVELASDNQYAEVVSLNRKKN